MTRVLGLGECVGDKIAANKINDCQTCKIYVKNIGIIVLKSRGARVEWL